MMKRILKMIVLFVSTSCAVFAQQSNQQMFRELVQSSLADNFSKVDLHSIRSISLGTTELDDEINLLIEDEIFQFVRAYEISIFQDSLKADTYTLNYQATSHQVNYKKVSKNQFERRVSIELFLRFNSPEKEILFSDLTTQTKTDTVSQNMAVLEDKNISYTIGNKKINRIFEPIIVSVVTGVIVYIFYSYRSK